MRKARNLGEIEKEELFHQLIEHRTRIYENLARDALALLRIQLLILPITVSLISFLFQFLNSGSSGASSVIESLVDGANLALLQVGISLGLTAIILSVLLYHFSRKWASSQSKYLVQWHQDDLLEPKTLTEQLRNKSEAFDLVFGWVYESAVQPHSDGITDLRMDITENPGDPNSWFTLIRAALTVDLFTTLSSALLIILSLVEVIVAPVLAISGGFLIAAAGLLLYLFSFSTVLIVVEYGISASRRIISVLLGVISSVLKTQARKVKEYFGDS